MIHYRHAVAVAALTGLTVITAPTAAAAATVDPCNTQAWFVNPDEADREPTRTYDGFVFEPADLIHHNAPEGLSTKDLESGDFTATPLPDQPSFFSVEVSGTDGGYATLRYNRLTHLWEMVTGGQFYSHEDPDKLVDLPPSKRSHTVVRFGIGYTKNPPGTVTTTVKSVSFQGKAFYFTCPKPTTSPTPSASPTKPSPTATSTGSPSVSATSSTPSHSSTPSTSSPSPSASSTTTSPTVVVPADSSGNLPTTGTSLGGVIAAGLGVGLLGALLVFGFRRRSRKNQQQV